METRHIGKLLRKFRKMRGLTVRDVVIRLHDDFQIDVADKTIYGWESDQSFPRTQTLLCLCELYHIDSISDSLSKNVSGENFPITTSERKLIQKFREHPQLQDAIWRILDTPAEK